MQNQEGQKVPNLAFKGRTVLVYERTRQLDHRIEALATPGARLDAARTPAGYVPPNPSDCLLFFELLEDRVVAERRFIEERPRRVVKTIEISEPGGSGVAERYEERVQLGAGTEYVLRGLEAGQRYYLAVTGENQWGESEKSEEAEAMAIFPVTGISTKS